MLEVAKGRHTSRNTFASYEFNLKEHSEFFVNAESRVGYYYAITVAKSQAGKVVKERLVSSQCLHGVYTGQTQKSQLKELATKHIVFTALKMAGGPGIEPGFLEPKSNVLPLDDPPTEVPS